MNLIDTDTSPTERTARRMRNALTGGYNYNKALWQELYSMIWTNPDGLSPQEALDIAGADSIQLFQLSNQLGELLNGLGAGLNVNVPDGVTYTANTDGTITLGS